MTAPTPPPPAVVTPGECEATRDEQPCRDTARLYPGGWFCGHCAPGTRPAPHTTS